MGCNCKNALKINEVNATEQSGIEKVLLFLKKAGLFSLAIVFAILITPIILVVIFYKMIFKKGGGITIPTKILNMLK
jgi:cytochrome c oxidase subunit IV